MDMCPRCGWGLYPYDEVHPITTPFHVPCQIHKQCYILCARAHIEAGEWDPKHISNRYGGTLEREVERRMEKKAKPYIVITRDDEGDVRVERYSHEELLEKFAPNDDYVAGSEWDASGVLPDVPDKSDPNYWGHERAILIIKGDVVFPKPVERVTEYVIE